MERRFSLSIPRDKNEGSWDRYGYWSLSDDCAIAFVADAPVAALRDSGRVIESAVGQTIERTSAEIENALRLGLGEVVAADLATIASDALVREGGGSAYAAVAIAVIHAGDVAVYCRGDCAVYVLSENPEGDKVVVRISGTTRVEGRAILPNQTGDRIEADHYEEGIYLGGAESRIVEPGEVWSVSGRRILMVSDGCEGQAGISKLLAFLKSDEFSKEAIRRLLESSPPRDDISALGIEIEMTRPAANPTPLAPSADEIGIERNAALEAEVAELRERLAGVERDLADSKTRNPAPVLRELPTAPESSAPVETETEVSRPLAGEAAGENPVPVNPRPKRVSPVRRFFGVVLSLAGLAAIGWLSWILYHEFLRELNEEESTGEDPAAEVSAPGESGAAREPENEVEAPVSSEN